MIQFHSLMTIQPSSAMISTSSRILTKILRRNIIQFSFCSGLEVVVVRLQAFAQMQHGVALARQQGVHTDAGVSRDLLEAASVQFVGDENLTLVCGQLIEGGAQRVEQRRALVSG